MYKVELDDKPPTVYLAHIKGVKITEDLWTALRRDILSFQPAEKLITDVFSDETPTFKLDHALPLVENSIFFDDLKVALPADRRHIWTEIGVALERVLRERGYQNSANIFTWQEHKLMVSTTSSSYSRQPYKPLGVIHSEMKGRPNLAPLNLEETRVARKLHVCTHVNSSYYKFRGCGRGVSIFLERLDRAGNTVCDPRVIDPTYLGMLLKLFPLEEAIERCVIKGVVKSDDFPKRRD